MNWKQECGQWAIEAVGSRRGRSLQGGGGLRSVKFVWEISRFQLAAKFPTRNPGSLRNFPHTAADTVDPGGEGLFAACALHVYKPSHFIQPPSHGTVFGP